MAEWRLLLFTIIVTVYLPICNVIRISVTPFQEGLAKRLPLCSASCPIVDFFIVSMHLYSINILIYFCIFLNLSSSKLANVFRLCDDPETGFLNRVADGISFCYTEGKSRHWLSEVRKCDNILYYEILIFCPSRIWEPSAPEPYNLRRPARSPLLIKQFCKIERISCGWTQFRKEIPELLRIRCYGNIGIFLKLL